MEKIKLYLDTNIIYTYFMQKAKELKDKRKIPLPRVFTFLEENKDKIEFYVSGLTELEIFRKIRTDFGLKEDEIIYLWGGFCNTLFPKQIKGEEINLAYLWDFIKDIVIRTPIKKRVTNLEHLGIAIQKNLIFVTGDKEVLKKCKSFYSQIMSYIELRRSLNYEEKYNYEKNKNV
jgi:hypothetical protein